MQPRLHVILGDTHTGELNSATTTPLMWEDDVDMYETPKLALEHAKALAGIDIED